ncbi:MAG: radical SAM protein [Phycisphaerae bacterium]|nr:radical SAM protein [Candidatus Paceibacterota bacterium]
MKISLNPQYAIRNELYCSYIINISTTIDNRVEKGYSIEEIPPIIGFIISKFNGKDYMDTIKEIATGLNLDLQSIKNFTDKLIENKTIKEIKWNNNSIYFPMYLLIKEEIKANVRFHKEYTAFADFKPHRPTIPFNVNLMITTKCKTDCIYCYADRNKKNDLKLNNVLKIIDEAYILGVVNFTITGGDIFANKNWRIILQRLISYGYKPFISTKIPLTEIEIQFLVSLGINEIQFSLDSIIPIELSKIIRVKSIYVDNVKNMFLYCNKHGLKLNIRTVLTRFNSSIESMDILMSELKKFSIIQSWILTPAFYSPYKEHYQIYSANEAQLNTLMIFFRTQKSNFYIYYNNVQDKLKASNDLFLSEKDFVQKNKSCNANSYSLSIISNGKVSICEMLYENDFFIIGDIKEKSLFKVWNSKKALDLYKGKLDLLLKQTIHSSQIEESPCTKCDFLTKCKKENSKKICYVDIVNIHGTGKYNFPDPRCPKALFVDKSLMI